MVRQRAGDLPAPIQLKVAVDGASPFVGTNYRGRRASYYGPHMRSPYVMTWTDGFQYQLADTMLVRLSGLRATVRPRAKVHGPQRTSVERYRRQLEPATETSRSRNGSQVRRIGTSWQRRPVTGLYRLRDPKQMEFLDATGSASGPASAGSAHEDQSAARGDDPAAACLRSVPEPPFWKKSVVARPYRQGY